MPGIVTEPEHRITRTAKTELEKHGFARVSRLFAERDLRAIEAIIDSLIFSRNPAYRSFKRDLSDRTAHRAASHPEFSRPTLAARQLKKSAVYLRCWEIAEVLLGSRPHYLFDHAIYKMPRSAVIPWHQDQAYLGRSGRIRSLHFWIPFQDTDARRGALRFVPGSHKSALLPHTSAYDGNPHVLTAPVPAHETSVELPLRQGDVSIHTNLTLHSSGPNHSDTVRKAWIIHFGNRPNWYKHLMQVVGYFSSGS
jgi:ectoine hydroxylase-related dioxygenase (phytanoyl-CoA dioxygenase family)